MNLARAESSRRAAQSSYDAQSPDYASDADEALQAWLDKCPEKLTGFQEADILRIAGRGW